MTSANQNPKKSSKNPQDMQVLKSDIASFASSLGLSSSQPSSGFNDVDFRKTGSLKHKKPTRERKTAKEPKPEDTQKPKDKNLDNGNVNHQKPKPKPPVLSLDDGGNKARGFDKFRNLPKLPLIKANAVGVWYVDAAELEKKVIGEGKRVGLENVEEWKSFVEKRRRWVKG
ncbi:CCAAT/enhancer-binding protein zeta [Quillaja saponaria]|uniref:CCAAT/enhancer-binding protein zeta n=1 Tax=Quillaja saponaria TaxID=32244 RepID=A0AAD7KN74_QUISA|nr:CCAAT/enhancer-binding protein zeta [Quillaja saponaria]